MPIELPRGLPFAVDTWTPASALKRHRFLTHAHRDHLSGIAATCAVSASTPVYASRLTVLIALRIFPQLDRAAFVELEVGDPPLRVTDPDGDFTVTAFDANHCPGAVMFLFEGPFGTVLHTGDCRLTPDCLSALMPFLTRRIDCLFLDCTFARCPLQFPTKEDSIRQVINCIWKHPNAPVYLVCDMLGQEDVLIEVSKAFGSKIYVDTEKNSDCHQTLTHVAPEILAPADAESSSRFHVIPFPRLSERATEIFALARAKQQHEPLIIRPSAQWYNYYEPADGLTQQKALLTEPMRDEFGVWHVCLSMHSSREELEQALDTVKPKWVVSTTPPCMAVDLSYVKKHCSLSRFGPDDPLWKLLGISDGMSTTVTVSPQQLPILESIKESEEEFSPCTDEFASDDISQVKAAEATLVDFEIRVEPPVTLFGSARFGLPQHESEMWKHEFESLEVVDHVEIATKDSSAEIGFHNNSKPTEEIIDLTEVPTKEQNSISESELLKDRKPDDGVQVVDLTEVPIKEQNSISESELLKDRKPDEGVQVVDLTEDERKELSLSVQPEHCMNDKGGNRDAELVEDREQNLTVHADLRQVCRHMVIDEGKNRIQVTRETSTVHATVSATINKEGTGDDTTTSETGKSSDQGSERQSDYSTTVGSSKGLNANLRRLYRSMNVSVPRPLPSLVELMAASKRPRVSQTMQL